MKKLATVLTIAVAMIVVSCFQASAVCPVNDESVQSVKDNAEAELSAAAQTAPRITVTGGAFRGSTWQVRVSVQNLSSQTILCKNIKVVFVPPTTGGISSGPASTETAEIPLAAGEKQEVFLNFLKVPTAEITKGARYYVTAYADCPTLSVSVFSQPYYFIYQ